MVRLSLVLLMAPLVPLLGEEQTGNADLVRQISELRAVVAALETRVSQLEKRAPYCNCTANSGCEVG
jgi:hypothetical protein